MESGKKTGCFPPCFGSVKKFFKRFCNRTKISPMPTTNRPQAGLTIIDLEESESVQDIIADELNNGSAHLVGDEQKAGSDAEGN